ncbi:SNF2 helicase associated domain-containing protein, partial [Lactimicrobium sp.]
MDWKTYFNERNLHKGLALWKARAVLNCKDNGDEVTGRVRESGRIYLTSVDLSDNFHASCTCRNAAMGMRCAHMAALLYARDARRHHQIDVHKPLFDARKDEKCYFNLARIFKDVQIPTEVIRQARIFVMDKTVTFEGVHTAYFSNYGLSDSSEQSLIIDGHIGTGDDQERVQVIVTHDRYVGGTCDVDYIYSSYYTSRLCAHQLALLILAEETIQHYNLGDATDYGAAQFLTAFAEKRTSRRLKEIGTKNNVIQLKPRLTITDDDKLELSMKIGTGKLYLIKDMSALLSQKDSGEIVKLGKNNEINFGMQDFLQEDEKYYRFLRTQVQESKAEFARFMRRYYDSYSYSRPSFPGIKNRIELSDHALDTFFDTAEGDVIEFVDKRPHGSSASSLHLKEGEAKLTLALHTSIDDERNVQAVDLQLPRSQVFHGSQYYYALQGDILYRLSQKEAEMLDTMGFGSHGSDHIRIGMRRLSEFYYHILPVLQQSGFFEIQEDEGIAEIVPQEGTYDFYLDRHDDILTLAAQVSFGDVSYRIIDDHWADYQNSPLRDHTYEREILDTVQLYYPDYDAEHHQFSADADDDTIYSILSEGIKALMMFGEVHVTDAFDKLRIRRTPVVSIGVRTENNLLDLSIATHDMSEEDLLALLDSYKQKKKYHRLSNGDFIELDQNDSLDVLSALFDTMNVSLDEFTNGKMQLPLYRALYINKLLEEHDSVAAERDRTFRNLIRNFENVRNSDYEVPASLQNTMRSYQIYGTEWMHTLLTCGFGGILADDMGLGKTLETIALLLSRKEEGIAKPSLVITPASVVYNWIEEFHRFAPQLKVIAVAGTAKIRSQLLSEKADVFVTSY